MKRRHCLLLFYEYLHDNEQSGRPACSYFALSIRKCVSSSNYHVGIHIHALCDLLLQCTSILLLTRHIFPHCC